MANLFDVLSQDHDEVRQMLADLESGPAASTGAADSQLREREKAVERLVIAESRHEAAEEEYFWPAVREKLSYPEGSRLSAHALLQEQEAKTMLNRLSRLRASDKEFENLLGTFIMAAREHIAFEETQVWPSMLSALSDHECRALGRKLLGGKRRAPTRPHPLTPPQPGILKAAGPAVAAADKLRDAVTRRGRH